MADEIKDSQSKLTDEQREQAKAILDRTRDEISAAGAGDLLVEFSIRRYIQVRLSHDERGKPGDRKKLKMKLFDQQQGQCPLCSQPLTALLGAELHRKVAAEGYTPENTALVHPECHRKQQKERNYS